MLEFVVALLLQTSPLTTAEAKAHIGKEATVCGKVASARWAMDSNRRPTFLNLDAAYPKQLFTAVIFEEHRAKFSPPAEEQVKDRNICVTGKIEEFRGTPEIVVTDPKQIREQKKPAGPL